MWQVHETTSVVQMHVRENGPAQFGRILASPAKHFGQGNVWVQLSRERLEFQAQPKWIVADVLLEMTGIAGVDQQIAGGMPDQDGPRGHADGKTAERFSRFDPAGRKTRQQPRDGGSDARMRRRRRKRRAVVIEYVEAGRDDRYKSEKQHRDALECARHSG